MALFQYQALDHEGKKQSGLIDADSLIDAKSELMKQKLLITALTPFKKKKHEKSHTQKDLINFTRELAKLLDAGLPLYECLLALEEKYRNHKMHYLILDLADQVKSGKPFSEALSTHRKTFDFLYSSMVANAEKSGSLSETLSEIAAFLKKQNDLKKRFLSSLLYPSMIGLFSIVVLFSLLFFVIPSLFDLYEGRSLHPFTQLVFSISKFASGHKTAIFSSFFLTVGGLAAALFSKRGKRIIQKTILKAPFVKPLMIKVALVRFCRSLSTLLEGGVSYVQAVELATEVMRHPPLQEELKVGRARLIEGEKLSDQLKLSSLVPPLVGRLVAIAEQGGEMGKMLMHLSDIYEEELEKTLNNISSILQPLLLLALGVLVGFVVLSVLLPLTDVSSFIDS